MITLADSSLVLDTRRATEMLCVFAHLVSFELNAPPEVIFVGTSKLIEVYEMKSAKNNSEWVRIFEHGGSVQLSILALGTEKQQMTRWAIQYMRSLPNYPRCNLHGKNMRGFARMIKCETTGQLFANQREACKAFGLQSATLSRHLQGDFPTASGKIFRFVNHTDLDDICQS